MKTLKNILWSAALAALALIIVACGSDEPIAESAQETPTTAAESTALPTTTPLETPADAPQSTVAPEPATAPAATEVPVPTVAPAAESSEQPVASSTGSTVNGVTAAQWASNVSIEVGEDSFRFVSDGLPAHELPDQFLVPNEGNMPPFTGDDISASFNIQNTSELIVASPLEVEIPLIPVYTEDVTLTALSTIGVTISGAPLFNDYEDQGREFVALDDNLSLDGVYFIDACNGHPLASGSSYHYHGVPYCVTDVVDVVGQHSTVIGFALDGFPIYGSKDTGGAQITNGQLDECSGHVGATPEFPGGIYHYHLTEDSAPYSVDCFHGVVDGYSSGGQGGPGGERPDGPRPEGAPPAGGDESAAGPPPATDDEGATADGPATDGEGPPPAGNDERPAGPGGDGAGNGPPDFAAASAALGITEEALRSALGGPPPDFEAAASALGISLEELQAALGVSS